MTQTIDFFDFVETLNRCGWAYSDAQEVKHKVSGASGFRYLLEKYDCNYPTIPFGELQKKLREVANAPEKIIFGKARYRYAPEICRHTIVIFD